MAQLLYGSGLRLMECVRLRIKDIDGDQGTVMVRGGKGGKDRIVPLPAAAKPLLAEGISLARKLWEEDREGNVAGVVLPDRLERKLPNAGKEWAWQWVFPALKLSVDPKSGLVRRHHVHENGVQKAVKRAAESAGISKRVTCHTLRNAYATHLLQSGTDIRTVQELLGHADVSTTMVYTHVCGRPGVSVRSPLDHD